MIGIKVCITNDADKNELYIAIVSIKQKAVDRLKTAL